MLKLAWHKPEKYPWLTQLLIRKSTSLRWRLPTRWRAIAWALLAKGGTYPARDPAGSKGQLLGDGDDGGADWRSGEFVL